MRIEKCWFCSSSIYPGHGIQFVRNDAKIFRFCRSKCHKNFKMKRNPRKVKWTKAYRRLHGKDMTQDTTFDFERKRNRPERYDRNKMHETLKAIPIIAKVRSGRQKSHIEKRFAGNKGKTLAWDKKQLNQDMGLIIEPTLGLTDEGKIKIPKQPQVEPNLAMEE
ncbi:putative ribosome biogenesis protein RLP24 [Silene latifolia]|uniref:putative ribosome biogenesis protein RLP24 n=1 Tax=Silene latifolia TaxID=37657 RepID=UPI003D789FB5